MANNKLQCRICAKLNFKEPLNIFEQPEGKILRHIEQLTGVMLKNSKYLPQHICWECFMELRQARAFRRRCLKTQNYFTTPEYKRIVKKEFKEKIKRQKSNRKSVQAEQYNVVGTTTTPIDQQYNYESIQNSKSQFLHDETGIAYENDSYDESSLILDVKAEVALAPTADYEIVEFEEGTSNAGNHTKSNNHNKIVKVKSGNHKGTQKVPKKRSITEYVCEQCGNSYDNVNHFRTHLNRHAGIKPFECDNCPSKFYTKSELKLHTLSHTGERPFDCQYCGRSYTSSGARLEHERLHTNDRRFKCTICPKGFRRGKDLKTHLVTHTKERKFECTICNKYFQRSTHLVAHNRSQLHKENAAKLENLNEDECEPRSID